jgi:hypothetical protein
MYFKHVLVIMIFSSFLCRRISKIHSTVNQYINKSILMRVAHALAKTIEQGTYRKRLSEALQASWSRLKRPLPVDLFVSSNAKPNKEEWVTTQNDAVNVAAGTEDAPTEVASVTSSAPKFKTKAARLLTYFLRESIDETVTVAKTAVHYRVHGGFCHRGSTSRSSWYKFMKQLRAHLGITGWRTMDVKRSELMALLPAPLAGETWLDLM